MSLNIARSASLLLTMLATVNIPLATAQDRGQQLYENHCLSCHESTVHIRGDKRATSFNDIQYQVGRWSEVLSLSWTEEEINDVVNYLNARYYQYQIDTQSDKK